MVAGFGLSLGTDDLKKAKVAKVLFEDALVFLDWWLHCISPALQVT